MRNPFQIHNLKALPVLVLAVLAFAMAGASAQSDEPLSIDIKPQPAGSALVTLAKASGMQILFAKGASTQVDVEGLKGEYRFEEALAALLTNTDLEYKFASDKLVLVQPAEQSADPEADEEALGEEGAEGDDPLELRGQTVTGSRLVLGTWQKPGQVIVLDREELERTGAPTLEQALRQLPQNINGTTEFGGAGLVGAGNEYEGLTGTANINGSSTVNLRGLGESATLILIEGKRVGDSGMLGGFTDISEIPMSMVERVEIQLDGASSVYGADAIGGVVNIILRKDYDVLRASVRRTANTSGGHSEHNVSVLAGTTWDSGSVLINLDGYRSSDQGVDRERYTLVEESVYSYPGNVFGRRGRPSSPREISPDLTQAARDAGVIGEDDDATHVAIPEGQDGTGLTLDDFVGAVNQYRVNEDPMQEFSMTPASDRYTVRVSAAQSISERLEVSGGVTYSSRETSSRSGAAVGGLEFRVAEENPYNPFGRDVYVRMDVPGFGTRMINGERDSLTLDLDFDGLLGDRWRWQWRSRYSNRDVFSETHNAIDDSFLARDLVDDDRSDPAEALNIFGDSFHTDGNNAILLASGVRHPSQTSMTTNRLASSEAIVEGALFSLPGGDVRGVVGAEWRRSSVDVDYGNTFVRVITTASPVPSSALVDGFALKGTNTVQAGFAELFFPILSERNNLAGVRDLNVLMSGRHESKDGSSSAGMETENHFVSNVWSAGLVYRPIEAVALRFNKSTSYRAPDVAHSLFPPLARSTRLLDRRGGDRVRYIAQHTTGGNPELGPEESTSLTWGVQLTPLDGLRLSIDWHDTAFRNRISDEANAFFFFGISDSFFERYPFQFTTDEEGMITEVDTRFVNIFKTATRGIDYQLTYEFAVGANTLEISANVATTDHYIEDVNPFDATPEADLVGRFLPARIYLAGLSWNRPGLNLSFNARTKSSLRYEKRENLSLTDTVVTVQVERKPATVVDFRGKFDIAELWPTAPNLLKGTVVAVGLNNVFRSYSERILTPEAISGDTGLPRGENDARGQMYYLEISKEF